MKKLFAWLFVSRTAEDQEWWRASKMEGKYQSLNLLVWAFVLMLVYAIFRMVFDGSSL